MRCKRNEEIGIVFPNQFYEERTHLGWQRVNDSIAHGTFLQPALLFAHVVTSSPLG